MGCVSILERIDFSHRDLKEAENILMGLDKKKALMKRNKDFDFVVIMIAYDGDGSDKIIDKEGHYMG